MEPPAAGWSALHHGLDPAAVPLLRPWLSLIWRLARPLAALRVPPTALTAVGVVLAADAVLFAARLPWIALALVLLSALCDGLDGAVAMLSRRVSAFGSVADKTADRIADCAFAAVLWRCGAPWPLALAAGALSLAHEGIRLVLGGRRLARITVAERPTRVICAALACACAGVSPATWPPAVCAGVWAGLAVIGLAQLVVR
ncbi:CDP-alcohol phosphatidyltransferase family protein [Jatrophihabitans cynanchi]|jgi:CDP-diacylglycerol--glycerol-3-phosphate 3-phosphatidyltransferase|uniref:CDP-alcohol phosphatidyltransferase family protein n=1 Tax=Jatrophihabitans cynanchi TaxID=2944128 RepID=A0ABY7JZM5_9ACTN|nr:CDP-alcohol phosphatidyltransferase family protein [Jatrophihabitans sp. SB3-54]WAX56777.1 CDP-alcohol phosphatidyltransferase family protein [Jatrophihabitans sp. SB3-54]